MTKLDATLKDTIERRARRAWSRRSANALKKLHRISDVTDTSLNYRLPFTPDYYGTEKVAVLLKPDGSVEIDPKTVGLIDCLLDSDVTKLKKHSGTVRAYALTKDDAKAGKAGLLTKGVLKVGDALDLKTGIDLMSRAACVNQVKPGDRVFSVELRADDIESHDYGSFRAGCGSFRASKFTVVSELDQQKDLGFTTGNLDLLTAADVDKLKKHLGKVRAYKYTDQNAQSPTNNPKITYKVGEVVEVKDANTDPSNDCASGINVASRSWITKNARGVTNRVFAVEFDGADVAAIPSSHDGKLRVFKCLVIEELSPGSFAPLTPPQPVAAPPVAAQSDPPTDKIADPVAPPEQPKSEHQADPKLDQKPRKGFFGRLFGADD